MALSENATSKAVHYTVESQRYYTIIKIECLIGDKMILDKSFKNKEYLIEEICLKYNGRKISKIEDNHYMFGCYLENDENLL